MRRTLVLALALVAFACAKEPAPEQTVNSLYFGGTIVTMVPGGPDVEAIAVKEGRIVDMGTFPAMHDAHAGSMTRMIDLHGGTLFPAVVDPAQAGDVAGILALLERGTAGATIAVGQPADFVILNRNPHDTAAARDGVRVMKIVRGGETVFRAQG